ncbi:MAG: hemolysin III family protein [Clostridiales bacterium]|nr:hemolysin III family protein [Candidatus Equinaster intestinalis]
MKRTSFKDRILPYYTRSEEKFNMISHIVGGGFSIAALVLCVVFSALRSDVWAVVSSAIYGASLVILYTSSSIYHGLYLSNGKKVMQVIDHCTIYFLIGGTYTPITLCAIRRVSPGWGWTVFGIVWGIAAVATVFTAIDLKRFSKLSMICYICMGWCIVIAAKITLKAIDLKGILWLLAGGVFYTIGAVLYAIGKKKRYVHSVFHIFVLIGSILQFISIFFYVL